MERVNSENSTASAFSFFKPIKDGLTKATLTDIEKQMKAGGPGCWGRLGSLVGVHNNQKLQIFLEEFIKRLNNKD